MQWTKDARVAEDLKIKGGKASFLWGIVFGGRELEYQD